jgi:glycine cleavage system H protein
MKIPNDLLYTETHEWVRVEDNQITIGITDYAQFQLKDVVYVELPEIGSIYKKGDPIGSVESVKTVSDIFSPVSGRVRETNIALKDQPDLINKDPYGKGWIVRMEVSDKKELLGLLSAKAYEDFLSKEN